MASPEINAAGTQKGRKHNGTDGNEKSGTNLAAAVQ